jgi:hypothetical protein
VKRTRPGSVIALGVVGLVATFLLEMALVSGGGSRFEPPVTLPLALVLIGAIVIGIAVPVWRTTRGKTAQRIDPFYATRVVLLAKASALCGGLLTGAGLGLVIYLLTLPAAGISSIVMAVAALVGAIVLLAAGLVAEHLCTVPPDDRDDHDGTPEHVTG